MGISKVCLGAASLALALAFAAPAAAQSQSTIKNAEDCTFEGGTMVNVKNSDYCLVQIRPEEYSGEEYDGNQLGIVECPGDKLNDGLFCMYPVTIRPQPAAAEVTPAVEAAPVEPVVEAAPAESMTDSVIDAVKEKAEDMAKEEAKKKATSLIKGK